MLVVDVRRFEVDGDEWGQRLLFCIAREKATTMEGLGFVSSGYGLLTRPSRAVAARRTRQCRVAMSSKGGEVVEGPFRGQFGDWFLTTEDVAGVRDYRLALTGAAVAAASGIGISVADISCPTAVLDSLYLLSNACLGVAFWKIHIYMRPMHNLLKALWAMGSVGAIAALSLSGDGLAVGTYEHTMWLLASGWTFVAMTGLFFKEAVCFNRQEAWGLMALVPTLTGGHFLHLLPESAERLGAIAFSAMFLFFCFRKLVQNPADDLGDKSVFDHYDELDAATKNQTKQA